MIVLIPVALFIAETLPKKKRSDESSGEGYGVVLRDRPFMSFIVVFTLLEIGAALTFNLLSVYVNEQYHILEDAYGLLLAINALMVVFFQYGITWLMRRYQPFAVIAAGSLFYTVGLAGFAFASTFGGFALAMVILTTGELMAMPTATALAANMALPEMRARYMGVLSLTYTIGTGVGPMIGGFLGTVFFPAAIWYAGAGAAFLAAMGFLILWRSMQAGLQPVTIGQEQVVSATPGSKPGATKSL
jgi:MFS family permease